MIPIRLDTSGWLHVNDSQAHLHMCVRMQGLLITRAGFSEGSKIEVSRLEPVTQKRLGFSLGCDSTSDLGSGEAKARLTEREKAWVPKAQHLYQIPVPPPPTPRRNQHNTHSHTHTLFPFMSFPF